MIERIFEEDQDTSTRRTTIYHFDRSPRFHFISKAIQRRNADKRRRHSIAGSVSEQKRSMSADVESPTKIAAILAASSSTIQQQNESSSGGGEKLTEADICRRLQELKDEKHRLFQIIKRLVFEEEEQERQRALQNASMSSMQKTATRPQSWIPASSSTVSLSGIYIYWNRTGFHCFSFFFQHNVPTISQENQPATAREA